MEEGRSEVGGTPLGGASRLLGSLAAFVAGASADEVVDQRRRARDLVAQAAEESTMVGVLLDLGERQARTVLATTGGRSHRGAIVLVGLDVVVLGLAPRGMALVRTGAIASLGTAPGTATVLGDRTIHVGVGWADALGVLAADRPRVDIGLAGGTTCRGELRSVGADVVAVQPEGRGARQYLALDATLDVVVDDVAMADAFRGVEAR